jgi:hypothetical protein
MAGRFNDVSGIQFDDLRAQAWEEIPQDWK